MREKIFTHNDVLNELEKKWPGFKKEVKAKADKLHIAYKIAEMRHRARLSQKALANKIGTKQSVVARMESPNYKDYRVSTLSKIAQALHSQLVVDFH